MSSGGALKRAAATRPSSDRIPSALATTIDSSHGARRCGGFVPVGPLTSSMRARLPGSAKSRDSTGTPPDRSNRTFRAFGLAQPFGFADNQARWAGGEPNAERCNATRPASRLERVDAVARGRPPPHNRAERFDQPSTPRGRMRQRRIVAVHADQAATHERGHIDGVHAL